MKIIIGFIILLLAIFVAGYLLKKKYYKEMDRLESWKIDLTNRPVLDELFKVKQLNMTGQTEELFESWRNQWDDLVTVNLPDLEELLFDAEEYIDQYRFNKAKEVQKQIEKNLMEIDNKIKKILEELNELVGSEEQNRIEVDQLKDLYREAKKNLLAHRHTYEQAEKRLETHLDEVLSRFQEFEAKTENGNYLEARETVLLIKSRLDQINFCMELIPPLLIECQSILPSQLVEIREGFREMVAQGYYLEHVKVEHEITLIEQELEKTLILIKETEVVKAEEGIKEMKEKIDILFDLLEIEVLAKQYVHQNESTAREQLEKVQNQNEKLNNEIIQVMKSYHLTEKDLEIERMLEKELSSVYKRFTILVEKIKLNETAQSILEEELKDLLVHLDTLHESHLHFSEKLQALRKDEIQAREKIAELTKNVGEVVRLISKSNVPGVPDSLKYLFEDGKESIENVKHQLEEKPLNISAVNQYLEVAILTVEKLVQTTTVMLENVMLVEKVIQYGNRYRSKYPSVSKGLLEAENSFRNFDYEKALEEAATSIEEVDPSALKKIESLISKE